MSEPGIESYPLLPRNPRKRNRPNSVSHGLHQRLCGEGNGSDQSVDLSLAKRDERKIGTSQVRNDATLLLLHFLQMWAVLQSLSLRWPWPRNWLRSTSFVFVFNLDVWELLKVYGNNTYHNAQGYQTPSSKLPIKYWSVLLGWTAIAFLGLLVSIMFCALSARRRQTSLVVQVSEGNLHLKANPRTATFPKSPIKRSETLKPAWGAGLHRHDAHQSCPWSYIANITSVQFKLHKLSWHILWASLFFPQIAKVKRIYIIAAQAVCLPIGIALARLFHCNDQGKLDVDNTQDCWKVNQNALSFFFFFFVALTRGFGADFSVLLSMAQSFFSFWFEGDTLGICCVCPCCLDWTAHLLPSLAD